MTNLTKKELEKIRETGAWTCDECGEKYGKKVIPLSTYHFGICSVCGEKTSITELRDYNYLRK